MSKSRFLALVAISLISTAAFATQGTSCQGNCASDGGSTTNNTTNSGGSGYGGSGVGIGVGVGTGGAGGSGGAGGTGGTGGSVRDSGNSSNVNLNTVSSRNDNTSGAAAFQTQSASAAGGSAAGGNGGSAAGGSSSANGGSSSAAGGQGAGNTTSVSSVYTAPVIPKPSSANAYAPDGKAPRASCRLFVGLGGTGRDGSLSGGIPIGNDQTCMSGAQIEAMDKANTVQAGTFLIGDYMLAICAMEGMGSTDGCKTRK